MAIDKRSPEYLFGQIMARLDGYEELTKQQTLKLEDIDTALGKLPCNLTQQKIKTIEEWQLNHNGVEQGKRQLTLKFWHGVILIIISTLIGALMGIFL